LDFRQEVMVMPMKRRRRRILVLLLLPLLCGLLLVPQVRWPMYGSLRGEAFYQGMPTSYWRHRIQQHERAKDAQKVTLNVDWIQKLKSVVGLLPDDLPPDILGRDPETLAVRIELLRDSDDRVRAAVATNIGMIGPAAREVIPLLIDMLQDPSVDVQLSAAMGLYYFGQEAGEALPSLRRLLELYRDHPYRALLMRLVIREIDAAGTANGIAPLGVP
jgi:HEAT repeats